VRWSGVGSTNEKSYLWNVDGTPFYTATVTITYGFDGDHYAQLIVSGQGGTSTPAYAKVTTPCHG
jgi:hypothetical protein